MRYIYLLNTNAYSHTNIILLSIIVSDLIQLTNQIRQHFIINIPIPCKCTASLLVPGQLTDYVWVGSFLVEVADECATGKVAACNVAKTLFLFFTSLGIDDSHNAVKSCIPEKISHS